MIIVASLVRNTSTSVVNYAYLCTYIILHVHDYVHILNSCSY